MTDRQRTDEILELLRAANPASASEIQATTTPAARHSARERAIRLAEASGSDSRRRRHRRTATRVALALAGAAAGAALLLIGFGSRTNPEQPEFAAAAVRVAEANERLLVNEPGWSVTSANGFSADQGEVVFGSPDFKPQEYKDYALSVRWLPAGDYEAEVESAEQTAVSQTEIGLLGETATFYRSQPIVNPQYEGELRTFTTILPPDGGTFVEIYGVSSAQGDYLRVLRSLAPTDVETWLAAMPPSVVQLADRSAVVDQMIDGVPVPPGFDVGDVRGSEDEVADRYQIGAELTSAIACEWLDRWVAATKAGDTETAQASVEAMSTSRDWPILREMADQGGWSQVVWQYSRELENGTLQTNNVAGTETTKDGRTYELGPSYAMGLGCDSMFRRLRESK